MAEIEFETEVVGLNTFIYAYQPEGNTFSVELLRMVAVDPRDEDLDGKNKGKTHEQVSLKVFTQVPSGKSPDEFYRQIRQAPLADEILADKTEVMGIKTVNFKNYSS